MPRPKNGYQNSLGQPVPGTGDITGRFMNRTRLLYWAYNRGKQGCAKLYDDTDLNIGTAVHTMAELDLQDRETADIEFYLSTTLKAPEHLDKARASFAAFRAWRGEFHVRPHAQEVSLVSEKHQFGGTLDTVAVVRNTLGLLEFKTSAEVYQDHLLQLAAYWRLWEETRPSEPLCSAHLILLPKDGAKFEHREYSREQLRPFWKLFKEYRRAFDLDQVCADPKVLAGMTVAPSIAPQKPQPRRTRIKAITNQPAAPATMAELLRSYGHLTNGATV